MKKKRARQSSKVIQQDVQAVGEGNKSMAIKQEKMKAAGEGGGDSKTNSLSGVRTRSSAKLAAVNSGQEAAHAYDCAAVSTLRPKAITNFPSSSPNNHNSRDSNPNFKPVPEPCLQEQNRSLRSQSHTPAASNITSVESISEYKPPRWEQLNFLQKMRLATPKARNRTYMAPSSFPEPTAIIEKHHDEHHKKKKRKQHSLLEIAGVGVSAEGSAKQGQSVPLLGDVEQLETSDAIIIHPSDRYCQDWSLEMIDGACYAHVITELNEDSVFSCDKILMENLPNEILRDRFQSALANMRSVLMEVLRRFKESNVKLQRMSKENEDLALHNNALVATTTMLGEHSKVQETKLKELEAELELCRSELIQSKTDLEQTEIEMEIELGAAKHEMAEMEAHHQAVLNKVEAKHKAALSKAAEMAVKEFKRSKACEDDLVALVAPAYGMGFTEALDLAKRSGVSIDLSKEAFARTYQPGSKDELMRRVALFKEGKDLSEFYEFDGMAEGEQLMLECSGDETAAEDNCKCIY